MNSQTFQDLEKLRDILVSLRPIFYDFKEIMQFISKQDQNSFIRITDACFNVKIRYYQMDSCCCNDTFVERKYKYRYFINILTPETLQILIQTENLEKEIQNVENKMENIKTFNRNKYILFLLSMK